jgi:voltage-gated potassium channel
MSERRRSERERRALAPELSSQAEIGGFLRRLAMLGLSISGLLIVGAVAYAALESTSLAYGLVWALDTVTTVGAIPEPASGGARALKSVVEILGIGTLFYGLVTIVEFFVAGHLGELLIARRTQKMIDALSEHHIVCGYGRVGRQVARDLLAAGVAVVVVDSDAAVREQATGNGLRFVHGDASSDRVLLLAGVERASSIIACADSDADNVFITLTARELRPEIAIVARAALEDSEKKLKRAGADRVISPYKASGTEMARLALHPQLSGVIDVAADYRIEEIVVGVGCAGAHQTIAEIYGGAMIVGLRRGSDFQFQPPGDAVLLPGDAVMAIGGSAALERLEALFTAGAPASPPGATGG